MTWSAALHVRIEHCTTYCKKRVFETVIYVCEQGLFRAASPIALTYPWSDNVTICSQNKPLNRRGWGQQVSGLPYPATTSGTWTIPAEQPNSKLTCSVFRDRHHQETVPPWRSSTPPLCDLQLAPSLSHRLHRGTHGVTVCQLWVTKALFLIRETDLAASWHFSVSLIMITFVGKQRSSCLATLKGQARTIRPETQKAFCNPAAGGGVGVSGGYRAKG